MYVYNWTFKDHGSSALHTDRPAAKCTFLATLPRIPRTKEERETAEGFPADGLLYVTQLTHLFGLHPFMYMHTTEMLPEL